MSFHVGGWDGDRSIGHYIERHIRTTFPHIHVHECGFLAEGLANWNNLRVFGSVWRAYYFLETGCWVEHDEQRYQLTPQQLVIVPQSAACSYRSIRQVPQCWIQFSLVPSHVFYAPAPFCIPVGETLHGLLAELMSETAALENTSELSAIGQNSDLRKLYHLALSVLNHGFAHSPVPIRVLPPAMQRVLQDINEASCHDYSCARLAKRHGVSGSVLSRWFQENLGESPSDYVARARIDKAHQMLAFTDSSIEQIADNLGFTNRHYFSRAFARHTGCGPATFRRQYREQISRPQTEACVSQEYF